MRGLPHGLQDARGRAAQRTVLRARLLPGSQVRPREALRTQSEEGRALAAQHDAVRRSALRARCRLFAWVRGRSGSPLTEITRILSPRGLVLVAVPDLEYWKGLYRRESYRYFRPDDLGQQHYVYYRQSSLSKLLSDSGFEVLAESKAQARPGNVAVAAWQGLARALHMRRELYFVARRSATA